MEQYPGIILLPRKHWVSIGEKSLVENIKALQHSQKACFAKSRRKFQALLVNLLKSQIERVWLCRLRKVKQALDFTV